jgi:hypothetical protein
MHLELSQLRLKALHKRNSAFVTFQPDIGVMEFPAYATETAGDTEQSFGIWMPYIEKGSLRGTDFHLP